MRKIIVAMDSLVRYLYAILLSFFPVPYRDAKSDKSILVVWSGHMGDMILGLQFLREFVKEFHERNGFTISIITKNAAKSFLKDICRFEGAELLTDEWMEEPRSFGYYVKCLRRFRQKQYDKIVAVFPSAAVTSFVMNLNARDKIVLRLDYRNTNWIKNFVKQRGYTKIITVPPDSMMYKQHEKLMHELGFLEYRSSIPKIAEAVQKDRYAIVSIDSRNPMRRWESYKFEQVINQIIERWQIPVVLTGLDSEKILAREMMGKISNPALVKNLVGETSLKELISLIQKSILVIGVDSGSVHLAAAVQTPSICIVGGYQYGVFHPYDVDILSEKDCLPVCVFNRQTTYCYKCISAHEKVGYGNKACRKEINEGRTFLCLQEITADDVMEKVIDFFAQCEKEG